ncbi:hypothetical protein, partial [Enterobacter hormaechei]|uniref:hypothetical protein n=1 Tax=Enterobacteriaceae TaxID=543 RepID=UPI002FEFFC5A
QNDVTLKMPAFEWVHVQLHQQKGMISLSPPTICNSAVLSNSDLSRRFVHRTSDRSRSEVLCTHGGQPSELVQSPSENDSGSLSRNLGLVRHVVFRRRLH